MRRLILASLLWVLLTALALCAFASIHADLPFTPQQRLALEAGRLQGAGLDMNSVGGELRVRGANAAGHTILLQPVPAFDATAYRYFSLELDEVPATVRAVLVWRSGGQLQAAPLPGAMFGRSTLDLDRVAAWQGRIDGVGFALMTTDYLAQTLDLDRAFGFVAGGLHSASWQGALRTLASDWLGYRPWNGRSNHTGGFEHSTEVGPSLQLFVATSLLAALVAAALTTGWAGVARISLPACVLALTVLAVWQTGQLALRARVAHTAVALADAAPEWPLAAMPMLAHETGQLERLLENEARGRLLVFAGSEFLRDYPVWLLRRFNVASLHHPAQIGLLTDVEGVVLVLAGEGEWTGSPSGRLRLGGHLLTVELLFAGQMLRAYRLRGVAEGTGS